MRKKLQTKLLLILIPPVVACVLFLGPLRGTAAASTTPAQAPSPATTPEASNLTLPQAPGLWQVGSALLGVLLIGAVGVMVIARLKGVRPLARPGDGTELLTLRQSLRLSARHHLHAVEFDGRVILLGECESNLAMLTTTGDPEITADERAIRDRADDVGVDLRDTPAAPRLAKKSTRPKRKRAAGPSAGPTAPATPPVKKARKTRKNKTAEPADAATANLADFKTLLQRARKKASV